VSTAWERKQRVRYHYDALGRRVQRVLGSGKENTKFIYDGLDVLVDDNSGTLTKYQNGPGIDNKLRVQTGSDVKYFLADHLGSTNGLADSTGTITASTDYDSFGSSTNGSFPSRYQYTGREFDSFTGLQFSRARWYDPNLGSFISEDPIGFRGRDINLYGYVRNNPILSNDALGLQVNPLYPSCVAGYTTLGGTVGFAAGGGIGALAGPGDFATIPAGAYVGTSIGGALGAGFGGVACGTPPFPNQSDRWSKPAPTTGTACQPLPRSIPFYQTPTTTWPRMPPDRDGCAQEWADAYEWCAENMGKPDRRGQTGGHTTLRACAAGRVSQRCGGNALDWGTR
jgi:RHS repeat-associated protein